MLDIANTMFKVGLVVTVLLYGYLFYGLFSGTFLTAGKDHAARLHAVEVVGQLSLWLNIAVFATVLSGAALYYEEVAFGSTLVLLGAFLAYGLQFCIGFLFTSSARDLTSGTAAQLTLNEIHTSALMIAIPGALLLLRHTVMRLFTGRHQIGGLKYGDNTVRTERRGPAIKALAKCWELPFCREAIRPRCPIFQARTKCWKEGVGCMCEENILTLAMSDQPATQPQVGMQVGFVPIGDLIAKSELDKRASIQMRVGPRGVKIPVSPHLTTGQKRERCRNCIIYNEHQRYKYQLLSPPATLAVPLLVIWQFEALREWVKIALIRIDGFVGHISYTVPGGSTNVAANVADNLPIVTMIILCLTFVFMTWAQRLLEYCVYKIKI